MFLSFVMATGSIPEHDVSTDNIYNTCTVYSPSGELVAIHRKVHLFDINFPGKMVFKESDSLTGGTTLNSFETRESDVKAIKERNA